MKKSFVMILILLSFFGYSCLNLFAHKKKCINLPPFDQLIFHKPFYLEFKYHKEKQKQDIPPPDHTFQSVKIETDLLILKTKPINEIFEQVKLSQKVRIELSFEIGSFNEIVKIGTFKPILKGIGRRTSSKVIIEKFTPVLFSKDFKKKFLHYQLKHDLPIDECDNCNLIFKNANNNVLACFNVLCYFSFEYEFKEFEKLNRLIVKEKFDEAEFFCKRQKGEIQLKCFQLLGDTFIKKKEYNKAAHFYEKALYKKGIDKIGTIYFKEGNYKEAITFFERGNHSSLRAKAYTLEADRSKKNNKFMLAKNYYKKALAEYEYLIKNYYYQWNTEDSTDRRRCYSELKKLPKTEEEIAQHKKLSRLLNKASIYSQRLMEEYFYFFCHEIITEYQNHSKISKKLGSAKNKYVYEYQLIKKDKKVKEYRILLKKNNQTFYIKNADLVTYFRYKILLLGPIAFFGKNCQDYFYYKILKGEILNEKQVTIIEIIPKYINTVNSLIGKIWVKEEDERFYVLKIEWNPKTIVENFDYLLELERIYKSNLFISIFVEFAVKRPGIRLPSKYYCEVSYINKKKKKKYIHSRTEVIFKNHKFFFVETEVKKIGIEEKNSRKF